jgi:FkbM family methyltransferase
MLTKTIKANLAITLRAVLRSYIRYTRFPGRNTAYEVYVRYCRFRKGQVSVHTLYGDTMQLVLPDEVCSTIYVTGEWEPIITRYIRSKLQPGDIFIDCGGYVGWYALVASRLVGPSGRIITIEANQAQFAHLTRNCERNHCANVRPVCAAVSNTTDVTDVYIPVTPNMGHATIDKDLAQREGMQLTGQVRADTLENLVGRDTLLHARFIKVDIEGSEFRALLPLFPVLNQFDPKTEWLIELWPEHLGQQRVDEIFHAFDRNGYGIFHIPNEYNGQFWLNPPAPAQLQRLSAPPLQHCDVLMSRRESVTT